MHNSIIKYSPSTTTLDICFIASQAAPAIAAAATVTIQFVCPLHLLTFRWALNSVQSHTYSYQIGPFDFLLLDITLHYGKLIFDG